MDLSWDELRFLRVLSREGSFLGAGRALGTSHTTALRRLAAIEARVGPVFLRGPGSAPTPLGRELVAVAESMEQAWSGLERHVRALKSAPLSVTTNDALAPLVLRALQPLVGRSESAEVTLQVTNENLDLEAGDADVALRPSERPPEQLHGRTLGRLAVGVYEAIGSSRAGSGWIAPTEALRLNPSTPWWSAMPEDARVALHCDHVITMREACAQGLGRCLLPRAVAREDSRLREVAAGPAGPKLWVLYPARVRQDARLRKLVDELVRILKSLEDVWTGR